MPPPRPYTLVAELTYQCPLHCPYCSNPVDIGEDRWRAQLDAIERGDSQPEAAV